MERKLPINDPPIKLDPMIKLIGNFTVSLIKKLTLLLFELFCIPINNKKNKQVLKVNEWIIFFNIRDIIL